MTDPQSAVVEAIASAVLNMDRPLSNGANVRALKNGTIEAQSYGPRPALNRRVVECMDRVAKGHGYTPDLERSTEAHRNGWHGVARRYILAEG